MSALAADGPDLPYKGELADNVACGDIIASDIIYKNSLVAFAASGGIQPVAGDLVFAGVAIEQVDGTGITLGDKQVRYITGGEILITGASGLNRTDEGVPIYSATDNPKDITVTSTTASQIGIMSRYISASSCWVKLNDNRS